jgi:hypothetical protein
VVEAVIVGAVLALAAGAMDLVAICSGTGVDALSFPAPANDDSDFPMQISSSLFWGYLWLVLNMVVVEVFRAVQLLASGRRVSWTNSISRALLRRFRAAFSPTKVEACADRDTGDAYSTSSREELMCELGLDDLASEHLSADDDNTWQQALSAGLVDISTEVSDTSDDDWNTSLAEVESMMTLTNNTNVDDAWNSNELSMAAQLGQVSTPSDHTTVDEWEDISLADEGEDAIDTSGYTTAEDESDDDDASVYSCLESVNAGDSHVCSTADSRSDSSSWSALGVSSNIAHTDATGDVWIYDGGDGTLAAGYVARSPDCYDLPGSGRSHHGGVAVGHGTHAQR